MDTGLYVTRWRQKTFVLDKKVTQKFSNHFHPHQFRNVVEEEDNPHPTKKNTNGNSTLC